ncbi:YybS family protein [uncultured Phascolarctobacterium sp.]|uniref:YybS family protein n=1 Tax=uncultured Phascolarctobacterium sp. TaxID=512296 RepID=UPI0026105515|nr:YybS family protein [uncultured Phascolarctobacterium sp.]
MIHKTSAMVEAGIMAAIAIVMALIIMYVPVLGVFVNFLWPLPIVICGCRHGLKWSIMTLLVATIIIAMIMSPINAFFLAAIFGLLGLILGECMRRHLSPMKLMLYGSVGGIIALVLNIVLSFLVLGIDPINMMFTSFDESLVQLAEYYREHGMSEADIKTSIDSYKEMFRMMRIIMPGAFFLCAPVMAFVNYIAAKKILVKLGESFEDFPDFILLKVPKWILWPYCISLLAVTYFYQTNQSSWMYNVSVNVQTVCSFALVFQGIVLLYWFVDVKKKPRWWANIGTLVLFTIPIFSQIMVYVGAFDLVFDFRKIRNS